MNAVMLPNPPRPPPDDAAAERLLRIAESAASALLEKAAVAAAELKLLAANGKHKELSDSIESLRESVSELTQTIVGLQRSHLRVLGAASLLGAILIFILSRALGA